jgi:hypothetical protein
MSKQPLSTFHELRLSYHAQLLDTIFYADDKGVPSNADKDSIASVRFARGIFQRLGREAKNAKPEGEITRLVGQRAGREFERTTASFIEDTFQRLRHLRPGTWHVLADGESLGIARYEQYSHLHEVALAAKMDPNLAVVLGSDYIIRPDIVVIRETEPDEKINAREALVDGDVTRLASLRRENGGEPLLHALISCKWPSRSDRAQNARSEALNLIRSRKGRVPHIFCVTGEPTPARLASIALGTGDIDCVYHFALTELMEAVSDQPGDGTAEEMLRIMVEGRRLKDIADLPLDLAV